MNQNIYSPGIWNLCFSKILDQQRYLLRKRRNPWRRRLDVLAKSWELQYFQVRANIVKQVRCRKPKTTWNETLRYLQRKLLKQRMTGWDKKLDRLRSNWKDRLERIKGGMLGMDIVAEKLGMNDLRGMLEKQEYRCALTGRLLTPDNCEMDHIIPLARGGNHTPDNAQLVIVDANKAKGQMTEDEFVQLCREVVLCADREALRVSGSL